MKKSLPVMNDVCPKCGCEEIDGINVNEMYNDFGDRVEKKEGYYCTKCDHEWWYKYTYKFVALKVEE